MKRSYVGVAIPIVALAALLLPSGQVHAVATEMEAADFCRSVAGMLASVKEDECLARRLVANGGRSVTDRPIFFKEYPPFPQRSPLGRVLLFGGIHGDEYASISVVFKWMEILDRHHSGMFHWHIVPLLNPDGLFRERPQRMNDNGVDLNRNFPSPDWQPEAVDYWQQRNEGNPRRNPGTAPASEPETRWLASEIERFAPDVIVSVHAPYGLVDVDGPVEGPVRLGSLPRRLLGTYPGSLGRYAGVHKGIPVITIELASAVSMPPHGEIAAMWVDLVRWLRTNLPRGGAGAAADHVKKGTAAGRD